jgi:hypothetical protein
MQKATIEGMIKNGVELNPKRLTALKGKISYTFSPHIPIIFSEVTCAEIYFKEREFLVNSLPKFREVF